MNKVIENIHKAIKAGESAAAHKLVESGGADGKADASAHAELSDEDFGDKCDTAGESGEGALIVKTERMDVGVDKAAACSSEPESRSRFAQTL